MSEKLQIFNPVQFDESIMREEVHTYHPHTKSFNNSDEIEIVINQQDVFVSMWDALLCIDGKFEKNVPPLANVPATSSPSCYISGNFAAYLFESISYELHGKEIEKVREPGIVSAIKTYLTCNDIEAKSLSICGWNWPTETNILTLETDDKTFHVRIPLYFLMGIFEDYKKVLMGKHTLKLVRARTDNNALRTSGGATGKFDLHNIELKVKHVYPNDTQKLRLLENIKKEKMLMIPYRKWELHELPALKNTNKDVWSVKTSTNLEKPRYIILAFQTDRHGNPESSKILFDHIDLVRLKVYLNSESYPYEPVKMDFSKNEYIEPYQMYLNFKSSFKNISDHQPLLDYTVFKWRCLYVIDCSKQNESIQQTTVDLKLEFESSKNFPDKTRAYCIIIHDSIMEYNPLSGVVRNLI